MTCYYKAITLIRWIVGACKMISFFPARYNDELLFSVISRYKEMGGFTDKQAFMQSLYNKRKTTYSVQLPIQMQDLVDNLPPSTILTADKLIKESTLAPYYTSFMSEEQTMNIYRAMMGDNSKSIDAMLGILSWTPTSYKYLRYCSKCLEEDLERYGESYWRRLHQVPGVLICDKHHISLQESSLLANNLRKDYSSPNYQICKGNQEVPNYSDEIVQLNIELIKNIKGLFKYDNQRKNADFFRLTYVNTLNSMGFVSESGNIKGQQLKKTFVQYYSEQYLSLLESTIDPNKENTWFSRMTRDTKKNKNPLHHLLYIQFLNLNIQELFEQQEPVKKIVEKPIKKQVSVVNLEQRRQKWLNIIEENSYCTRSQLKEIGGGTYTWIVRYDKEWYQEVTPKNKSVTIGRSGGRYYTVSEEEVLDKVKKAIQTLRAYDGKPIRITYSAIKREAGITLKLKNERFKQVYDYIQTNIEPLEDYRIRKIKWAIEELIQTDYKITPYKVEQKAGFNGKKAKEVRRLIQQVLN